MERLKTRLALWLVSSCGMKVRILDPERNIYASRQVDGAMCFLNIIVINSQIVLGAEPEELHALVCHEEGHKKLHGLLSLFRPIRAVEYEADDYAVSCGHCLGLIKYLRRWCQPSPLTKARIKRLEAGDEAMDG